MSPSFKRTALQAAILLTFATTAYTQSSVVAGYGAITTLACYQNVSPLVSYGSDDFMTDGECQQDCAGQGDKVMAIVGGSTCYCGGIIPSRDKIVSSSNCNTPCAGYNQKMCGGIGYYQLYLTGLGADVQTAANGTDTASNFTSSATPSAVVTKPGQTVVVTQPSNPGGGPSKVGIAVGVVVALVLVAICIGATIFLLRQRKKRALEEEHRRNAAIAEFTSAKKSEASSVTDSRLDASFLSSNRRESIGSIADEMDFTRRILQVRNPDHRASNASNFA